MDSTEQRFIWDEFDLSELCPICGYEILVDGGECSNPNTPHSKLEREKFLEREVMNNVD